MRTDVTRRITDALAETAEQATYGGLWSVYPPWIEALQSSGRGLAAGAPSSAAKTDRAYPVSDGIARINLIGPVLKYDSDFGPGSLRLRAALRQAALDDEVAGILLRIDSPGGIVYGTADFADDVAWASRQKPVLTYFEDLGTSAAYWIGSHASEVWANRSAGIGSIGTYAVVWDTSKLAEKAGIKVHVIQAGEYKAAGVPGTEITEKQLANWQRQIDELNGLFVGAISEARGIDARKLADGRVHVASRAKELGLIDQVGTIDDVLDRLHGLIGKEIDMGQEKGQAAEGADAVVERPATRLEIEAEFPRSRASRFFVEDCVEQHMTLREVRARWDELEAEPKVSIRSTARIAAEVQRKAAAKQRAELADNPEAWKAEYERSPELREEFGSAAAYVAYRQAESAGRVKLPKVARERVSGSQSLVKMIG